MGLSQKLKAGALLALVTAVLGCSGDDGAQTNPMSGTAGTNPAGGTAGRAVLVGTAGTNPTGGMAGTMNTGGMAAGTMMTGGTMDTGGTMMTGGTGGTPAANGAPTCEGSGAPLEGACRENANGIYALKTEVDVWWPEVGDPPVMDAGRGKITIWLMGDLHDVCEDGTGGVGTMRACGADVPPFVSDLTCDAYKLEFPDSVWDSPEMPTFETTGSTNGFTPGSVLDIAKATGLVGISLNDPDNDPWPTSDQTANITCPEGTGAECFPDHDGDGKPGITISMRNDGSQHAASGCGGFNSPFVYRGAPPSVADGALAGGGSGGGRRAVTFRIGLRNTLGGGGAINDDCASGMGDAMADRVESRVWECELDPASAGGETACTEDESVFVDTNSPVYTVLNKGEVPPTTIDLPQPQRDNGFSFDRTESLGPQAFVKRLGNPGETFTCADVRAALP